MAQYGGQQLRKPEGEYQTEEHAHNNNPLHSTTAGHNIGGQEAKHGTATTMGMGAGHGGQEAKHGTQTTMGMGAGQEAKHGTQTTMGMGAGQEAKHGTGGILHRSGSGSSSSSEDDGEGGRRKKKGVMGKIKEKLPCGDHGTDEHKTPATETIDGGVGVGAGGYEGAEAHEKKGLMEKIKQKLPGGN